jgi:hypothetical protein
MDDLRLARERVRLAETLLARHQNAIEAARMRQGALLAEARELEEQIADGPRVAREIITELECARAALTACEFENAPHVCPGCHAVGGPHGPGCIDAEIEAEALHGSDEWCLDCMSTECRCEDDSADDLEERLDRALDAVPEPCPHEARSGELSPHPGARTCTAPHDAARCATCPRRPL